MSKFRGFCHRDYSILKVGRVRLNGNFITNKIVSVVVKVRGTSGWTGEIYGERMRLYLKGIFLVLDYYKLSFFMGIWC